MVNSVTFDPAVGGDGSTVTDDANDTTGLAGGGHRLRFIPALAQVIRVAQFILTQATGAAASAVTALNAPGTNATCPTSLTASVASKAFTLGQVNKAYQKGQFLIFSSDSNPAIWMVGQLTAFVSATGVGTLNALQIGTAGTKADWNVSLTAPYDATISGQVAALQTEMARLKGRRRLETKELL